MVNQFDRTNKMENKKNTTIETNKSDILVETISESENNEGNDVICSEHLQITRKKEKMDSKEKLKEKNEENQPVPETGRNLRRRISNKEKQDIETPPTATNKILKAQVQSGETKNGKHFDTRLLINSNTRVTTEAFLAIIREYNA